MTVHRQILRRALIPIVVLGTLVGCSSTSAEDEAEEQQLATAFIASLDAAGIAPRLTVDVAESLYGTDASSVCDAFDGGTTTSGDLILRGNLAQGRRKAITDEAVIYAGLVVQTYCPDVLSDFEDAVADIDPMDTDR